MASPAPPRARIATARLVGARAATLPALLSAVGGDSVVEMPIHRLELFLAVAGDRLLR